MKKVIKILGLLGIVLGVAALPVKVTRVIDGDTVVLSNGIHVRLIGIDTPEKNACFANEATKLTENLLLNKKITLKTDVDALDQFGRTLGYLITEDKKLGMWKTCGPCDIKGNYDIHGTRYYHLPSFRHYNQVVINLDKGDRWLCGEDYAIKAGYTRARE